MTRDRWVFVAIVVIFAAVYLLLASREQPWGDAKVMFAVAEAIVERGEISIEHLWPPMSHRGEDGRVYSQYALLPSLAHIPGALLLEVAGPRWQKLLVPFAAQIGPSFSAAVGCGLFFALCRSSSAGIRSSVVGAAVLGGCTMIAVYARRPFSEALQVACFVGFLLALVRFDAGPGRGRAIVLGLAVGLLLNVKLVFALGIAFAFIVIAFRRRASLSDWGFIGAGALLPVALLLGYNAARWGSIWETGYDATLELADESVFWGVFGLALSPGKSVFLYNPPLLLAPLGVAKIRREHGWLLLMVAAATLPVMIFYGRFLNWGGGWCWGPRYWAFAVPALLLPIVLWMEHARPRPRIAYAGLILAGAIVSVLGNAFYWDHYIRMVRRIQPKWLGEPDRSGAVIDERGRGHCDSCLEDTYGLLWLPQFQPIAGHAWLLQSIARGHDWETARFNAPWSNHTSIEFDFPKTYKRAHPDLWPLTWRDDDRRMGFGILAALGGLFVLGVFAARRATRPLPPRQ